MGKDCLSFVLPCVIFISLQGTAFSSVRASSPPILVSQLKPLNTKAPPIYINRFQVAGIKSSIPAGTVIGVRHCHSGALWIKQHCGENTSGGLSKEATESLTKAIESGLASKVTHTGDPHLSSSGSSFFGDQSVASNSKRLNLPRYLVGVTITGAKLDSKQSMNVFTMTFSWKTEGKLKTQWEIYDNKENKIVVNETITVDSISVPGDNMLAAVIQGVSKAAQQFALSKIANSL